MRILLTNDDGAGSPGILLLADALRAAGHRVFMVAPAADNSGVSHALSFFKGRLEFAEIGRDEWSLNGTPADCVAVALRGGIPELDMDFGSPPDAVVSGINRGSNLGTDIVYSGTAAAARQGAMCGVPSLALSLVYPGTESGEVPEGTAGAGWDWEAAVAFAAARLDEMLGMWAPGAFLNVNIPNRGSPPLGLAKAFPSMRFYNDRVRLESEGGTVFAAPISFEIGTKPEEGSDWHAVSRGYAAVSAVCVRPVLLEEVNPSGR